MACHLRLTGDRVRFGQPEINLGIIPGFGGTQRLPRLIGVSKALELMLTGAMISAKEAEAVGLVDKVVPEQDLMREARGLARMISNRGRVPITLIMRAV